MTSLLNQSRHRCHYMGQQQKVQNPIRCQRENAAPDQFLHFFVSEYTFNNLNEIYYYFLATFISCYALFTVKACMRGSRKFSWLMRGVMIKTPLKAGHHRPACETSLKWRFAGVPRIAQRRMLAW